MAEYIEREKLIEHLQKDPLFELVERYGITGVIESIPAADVRPVVLCGECKFWGRERISCEGLARCNTGESGVRYRNRNDFCSRGEKREES